MKVSLLVLVAGLLVLGKVNGQNTWLTKWPTITSCICSTGYNANNALAFLKNCSLANEPCANCFLACQREFMGAMSASGAVTVAFYTSRIPGLTAAQVQDCDKPFANEKDKCIRARGVEDCLRKLKPTSCVSF